MKMTFAHRRILIKLKWIICFPWVLLTLGFWMALAYTRDLKIQYLKLRYLYLKMIQIRLKRYPNRPTDRVALDVAWKIIYRSKTRAKKSS